MKHYLLRATLCVVFLSSCSIAVTAETKSEWKQSKGITVLLTADGKIDISPLAASNVKPTPLPDNAIRFTCQDFEFDFLADDNGKPVASVCLKGQVKAQLKEHELSADGLVLRLALKEDDSESPKNFALEFLKFKAQGNIQIKSPNFTAHCTQVSFDQAGDLIILEGDAKKLATVYHQQKVDGPKSKLLAQRIIYRPLDRSLKVVGAQSFDLKLGRHR